MTMNGGGEGGCGYTGGRGCSLSTRRDTRDVPVGGGGAAVVAEILARERGTPAAAR